MKRARNLSLMEQGSQSVVAGKCVRWINNSLYGIDEVIFYRSLISFMNTKERQRAQAKDRMRDL